MYSSLGISLKFQVGKKVPLDTSDVNSSAEKRRLYSALDVRHLYNTMQPTDCALNNTLKSPMNALDDTLYSQVPPVPGSILPQSKSMTYEAGMHVTLVCTFANILYIKF